MPGTIQSYFRQYRGTKEGFVAFHNEVINMPRPDFQNMGLKILQTLASYLLLIEHRADDVLGNNYKEIMNLIHSEILRGRFPDNRNIEFENLYFKFENLDLQYSNSGRMFRHYMGLCSFWGLISSVSRQNKKILFDRCRDILSIPQSHLTDFVRNLSLSIEIRTNDFIKQLKGLPTIQANANYQPTLAILQYMKEINRPVSDFELSVLLGRVDSLQEHHLILQRALDIGKAFSTNNRTGQQQEFFRNMSWIDSAGHLFSYTSSQQPWFKFHTYLLFLEDFGLIKKETNTELYFITQDALSLLGDIPACILDLNRLLACLEDGNATSAKTMKDILLNVNRVALKSLISNELLLKKINRYSLANPIYHKGKKTRNQFIAELARIREGYICQAGSTTFERPDGNSYVEAHHIIEFSKGGPDILENLLILGPTPHAQIHRGSDRARNDMYTHLMTRGAIRFDLFKTMVREYKALEIGHINFLFENHLISTEQKHELITLLHSK